MDEQLSLLDLLEELENQTTEETDETTDDTSLTLEYLPLDDPTYSEDLPAITTDHLHTFFHMDYYRTHQHRTKYASKEAPLRSEDLLHFMDDTAFSLKTFSRMRESFLRFFDSGNRFSGEEATELKRRLNTNTLIYESLYKPTFLVDGFEQLPFINLKNVHGKTLQFTTIVLNKLFPYFEKTFEDNVFSVVIPDDYLNRLDQLLVQFPSTFEELALVKEDSMNDYFLLNNYVYFLRNNAKPQVNVSFIDSILNRRFRYYRTVNWDSETSTLSIHLDNLCVDKRALHSGRNYYYYMKELLSVFTAAHFLVEAHPLFESIFKEEDAQMQELDSDVFDAFIQNLEERLIPVDEVDHKTGVTKAKKAGLTHFFLPFSNRQPLFLTETPLLVDESMSHDDSVLLLPFYSKSFKPATQRLTTYKGYFDKYPTLASRSAPHIVGDEHEPGVIDEEMFNEYLFGVLREAAPNLAHALETTLEIIDQHQLVKNRLEAVYYEEDRQTEDLENLYESMFKTSLTIPDVPINRIYNLVDDQEVPLALNQTYRFEPSGDAPAFCFYVKSIRRERVSSDETHFMVSGTNEGDEETVINNAEDYTIVKVDIYETPFITHLIVSTAHAQRGNDAPYTFVFLDKSKLRLYYIQKDEVLAEEQLRHYQSDFTSSAKAFMRQVNEEHQLYDDPYMVPFIQGTFHYHTSGYANVRTTLLYIEGGNN